MTTQRYYHMDNLRAFLMLTGVMLHSAIFLVPLSMLANWPIHNSQTSTVYFYLVEFIRVWYMPLFYLLAGFFSHRMFKNRGLVSFIKNRLFRIGLPFLICFLILSIYSTGIFIALYRQGMPISWHNVSIILGFIGSLWFLYYLLLYYALILLCHIIFSRIVSVAVIARSLRRSNPRNDTANTTLLILACMIAGFFTLWIYNSILPLFPFSLVINPAYFFYFFVFFIFGWIIYPEIKHLEYIGRCGWLMLLIGGCISFPGFIWLLQTHPNPHFLQMIFLTISGWFLALGFLGVFYRWVNQFFSVLRYLADASYWFYLVQIPIIVFLQAYLTFLSVPIFFKLLYVFIFALVIMGITYALFVRRTFLGILLNGDVRRRDVDQTTKNKTTA